MGFLSFSKNYIYDLSQNTAINTSGFVVDTAYTEEDGVELIDTAGSLFEDESGQKTEDTYGYHTDLSDLRKVITDENLYNYLDNIYHFASGNIKAFRLESFQDGSVYLEFDTDDNLLNSKSDNAIGMDLSYESAVKFKLNSDNTVEYMNILDEQDITNMQNGDNYKRTTVYFNNGIPYSIDDIVDVQSLKDNFFEPNKINLYTEDEILSSIDSDEGKVEYAHIRDEQAKMITHLLNPVNESKSGYKNDIINSQQKMVTLGSSWNNFMQGVYNAIQNFSSLLDSN